jgi:NAD(P)-dependent dehydrogenase (short-subunit alcohol dehydrogenase family)
VDALRFDDLNYSFLQYDAWTAYGQSKTANILFAVGVGQRWADDGIVANALMPGSIRTGLQRHIDQEWYESLREQLKDVMPTKSTEQGAATSVLLAASPLVDGISGRYFEDVNEAELAARETHRAVRLDSPLAQVFRLEVRNLQSFVDLLQLIVKYAMVAA